MALDKRVTLKVDRYTTHDSVSITFDTDIGAIPNSCASELGSHILGMLTEKGFSSIINNIADGQPL